MVLTLVRFDVDLYIGALALAISASRQLWETFTITAVAMLLSALTAGLYQAEASGVLSKRGFDLSLTLYIASVLKWCSLATMVYSFGLSAGVYTPKFDVSFYERVFLVATVAMGAGVQPILSNFAAGLLLVLFRPFRVGDDITAGGHFFTVRSITAFFTHGSIKKDNLHVAIPNNKIIVDTLRNWTSNPTMTLNLSVHVRFGRQPCSKVREAMVKAADAFDAKVLGVLEKFPIEDPKALLDGVPKGAATVYGPQAITENGVLWIFKPRIPEVAMLRCMDLGNECIHDALMDAGVEVYETCFETAPKQKQK
jgi:hypothetical protein